MSLVTDKQEGNWSFYDLLLCLKYQKCACSLFSLEECTSNLPVVALEEFFVLAAIGLAHFLPKQEKNIRL